VIALREIAEGLVTNEILHRESEMEAEEELAEVMDASEAL
jgi:DNA-directed RNA polymerase subunit omega